MRVLHPANVTELANIAREIGAEVVQGPLRYLGEPGDWQVDAVDLSEHLSQYQGREILVIIATFDQSESRESTCTSCGFVIDEPRNCPRCNFISQITALTTQASDEELEAMLKEARQILRGQDE
jgi:hypothetical protein